mmetsp:Transcript_33569/g.38586  ORF Transcript_33569/g.38586 Transcript_33569/m.38586 type:complete len:138 (+) Transcript_33569:48-461(+)
MVKSLSFDFATEFNPIAYSTLGAGVRLQNTVKLLPAVTNRSGALFLSQKYLSAGLVVDITFRFVSDRQSSDGLTVWYLHQLPSLDQFGHNIHGLDTNNNGLDIRLLKTDSWAWVLYAHYDRGEGTGLGQAKIRPDNS